MLGSVPDRILSKRVRDGVSCAGTRSRSQLDWASDDGRGQWWWRDDEGMHGNSMGFRPSFGVQLLAWRASCVTNDAR